MTRRRKALSRARDFPTTGPATARGLRHDDDSSSAPPPPPPPPPSQPAEPAASRHERPWQGALHAPPRRRSSESTVRDGEVPGPAPHAVRVFATRWGTGLDRYLKLTVTRGTAARPTPGAARASSPTHRTTWAQAGRPLPRPAGRVPADGRGRRPRPRVECVAGRRVAHVSRPSRRSRRRTLPKGARPASTSSGRRGRESVPTASRACPVRGGGRHSARRHAWRRKAKTQRCGVPRDMNTRGHVDLGPLDGSFPSPMSRSGSRP